MTWLAVGLWVAVPNLFGMAGNVFGGMVTDTLVRRTGSVDLGRKLGFVGAFSLGALSMTLPYVSDALAILIMGLALFGNQWVAATYIGAVGDVVPQTLAGRVNGIAGLADNGATTLAVLYTGIMVDKDGWKPVFFASACFLCPRDGQRVPRATAHRAGDVQQELTAVKRGALKRS